MQRDELEKECHRRTGVGRWLCQALQVRTREIPALAYSWLYFFCLLAAYYMIRPLRDEMGVAGGTENLQWLFTATLIAILACNIPFAALARKVSRVRLIALTYRFFICNLLLFALVIWWGHPAFHVWTGRLFFVWSSVFNLFAVSVFWSLMVDVFDVNQGKRLFGLISASGTLGAMTGSATIAFLSVYFRPVYLVLLAALLLQIAVICVGRLSRISSQLHHNPLEAAPLGGSVISGFTHTFQSRYLLSIAAYVLLSTLASTALYFQQAEIVGRHSTVSSIRTSLFAQIDLWVSALTLIFQLTLTGRVVKTVGVGLTLAALPFVYLIGFGTLTWHSTLFVLVSFQVLTRAMSFAIVNPARELLFTVASREDKYKAKSFIDTVIYRAGDQIGAWLHAGLNAMGSGLQGSAAMILPLSTAWFVLALWLGARQRQIAATRRRASSVETKMDSTNSSG